MGRNSYESDDSAKPIELPSKRETHRSGAKPLVYRRAWAVNLARNQRPRHDWRGLFASVGKRIIDEDSFDRIFVVWQSAVWLRRRWPGRCQLWAAISLSRCALLFLDVGNEIWRAVVALDLGAVGFNSEPSRVADGAGKGDGAIVAGAGVKSGEFDFHGVGFYVMFS